jgi:hypothetical protein
MLLGRGVAHCGLAIYIKKYLKEKERINENSKYFTMQKKYDLQKNLLKETTTILQGRYYNSITRISSFQHKPKISSFKNPHTEIDLFIIPEATILYNEFKHNILFCLGRQGQQQRLGLHTYFFSSWIKTSTTAASAGC